MLDVLQRGVPHETYAASAVRSVVCRQQIHSVWIRRDKHSAVEVSCFRKIRSGENCYDNGKSDDHDKTRVVVRMPAVWAVNEG